MAHIKQLNESIKQIDTTYFEFDNQFKRHTLKNIQIEFPPYEFRMSAIPKDQQKQLVAAGRAIQSFMRRAQDTLKNAEYLLIIEGQSSNDNFGTNWDGTWKTGAENRNNDILSYQRAFNLVQFWTENGITFDHLPCEIIISGSGTHSKFREQPDIPPYNQRFVIHIIPKPGNFD